MATALAAAHTIDREPLHPVGFLEPKPREHAAIPSLRLHQQVAQVPPQRLRIYRQRIAYVVERERARSALAENPVARFGEALAFARGERRTPVLHDVDRINQYREHQALFAGQPMVAAEVEELDGQDDI